MNRDNRWVQNLWSASINDKGEYSCEVAAAIDRLYFDRAHAWEVEQDWWKRGPEDFKDQLALCKLCAPAQPGPSQLDGLQLDIISEAYRKKLKALGCPAIARGAYELFDGSLHTLGRRAAADNFLGGEGRRVGVAHRALRPKNLSGVVVSVGYSEHLKATLPANVGHFDELVVVTSAEDVKTQETAKEHGAVVVISNRCFDEDHAFNKGRMLNDGVAALSFPDWVVFTDAEITLNSGARAFVMSHALNPGRLYFTAREDHGIQADDRSKINVEPNGYFQLFNVKAQAIRHRWPKLISEEFCSAGGVDTWFAQQWPVNERLPIIELAVSHAPSAFVGQNWNGAAETCGRWTQLGVLTTHGFATIAPLERAPEQIKLTDTLFGQTIVIAANTVNDDVRIVPEGLEFLGRPIGQSHIHVAFKS